MHSSTHGSGEYRRGRVLVIDDEPLVARALAIFLNLEHDVTTTSSAGDALARLGAGEEYDAILCDLMMPRMTGMEFHAALAERHPDHVERVVFITGGAITERARSFLAEGDRECLDKPPHPEELRACIRRKVEQSARGRGSVASQR